MPDEDTLLQARFIELAQRAERQNRTLYSPFLSLAQIDLLYRCRNRLCCPFTLFGGHDACERRMAAFGFDLAPEAFPIARLHIAPRSEKFAQALSHRDFLGTMLGLGIKRETIGDIFVYNSGAYVFCTDVMAPYLCEHLTLVNRTSVQCDKVTCIPDDCLPKPQYRRINIASARLDAMAAAVFPLSRSQCSALAAQKKLFLNSRIVTDASRIVPEGAIVSVRGFGRFRYLGPEKSTRKQRLLVGVEVF